jgi:2-amino-4-hydroxy-6-hydroxymethyldihydropteridine diphosphokinase
MIETYLGIGSNQQDPPRQIYQAITKIKQLPSTRFLNHRELILTPAFGVVRQPSFYNTIIHIETHLTPERLLSLLQAIEVKLGRKRYLPWGPRVIDIDVLIYGNEKRRSKRLKLPHPQIWERDFVTRQLIEFDSSLIKKLLNITSK